MPRKSFAKLFIAFAILFFPINSMGETTVFTNQDIEKYKRPSDNKASDIKTGKNVEKKEKAQKISDEKEKEHWCKRATPYRKRIERIKEEIAELEKINIKAAGKRLENAKKRLRYAEKDLADLESEAHRKGIPPGWLRCQFE